MAETAQTIFGEVNKSIESNNQQNAKNALYKIHELVKMGIDPKANEEVIKKAADDAKIYGDALKAYLLYLLTTMNKSNTTSDELRKYATNLLNGIGLAINAPQ
jgi:hypothetical protein